MPRKQRFKPSRKPKPIPQAEEPMIERAPNSAQVHNDNVDARAATSSSEASSTVEPDPDRQSR